MTVPNTFANATTAIPLVQLDQNFNTGVTLGNTTVFLGNTTTSLGNVTLTGANVTATTLNTTGNTTIFGTTTNNSATAGYVGEVISSNVLVGSAVALTTNVVANVTSILLTAGDWDVNGWVGFRAGGATTITYLRTSISITSATTNSAWQSNMEAAITANSVDPALQLGPYQQLLSGTTTVYLTANAGFAVSTLSAFGQLRARRVR